MSTFISLWAQLFWNGPIPFLRGRIGSDSQVRVMPSSAVAGKNRLKSTTSSKAEELKLLNLQSWMFQPILVQSGQSCSLAKWTRPKPTRLPCLQR
jgi:hypothetical protein